jgi:hypothetical protein
MNREHQSRYLLPLILGAIYLSTPALSQTASAGDRGERHASNVGPSATMRHHARLESVARPDDLGTYMEDLSAFGTSAQAATEVSRPPGATGPQTAAAATRSLPTATALRALLVSPEIVAVDDLGTYSEDLSAFGAAAAHVTTAVASAAIHVQESMDGPSTTARSMLSDRTRPRSSRPTTYSTAYTDDLSAFGRSARIAVSARGEEMAPADIRESGNPAGDVDLVALRAWIRSSGFQGSDDLGTYMEDYAQTAEFADSEAARRAAPARKTSRRASVPVSGQDEPSRAATDEPDWIETASWTTHRSASARASSSAELGRDRSRVPVDKRE